MARGRVERVLARRGRVEGEGIVCTLQPERLIVEEPMVIRLDGVTVATTMRTPGNDFELAVGFCFTDGLLGGASVRAVRYCVESEQNALNTVTVSTDGHAPAPVTRLSTASSSCGWCGSDQLDELTARLDPLPAHDPIPLEVVAGVADTVRARQELFAETGSVHAAAVFDRDGVVSLVREDVGRHNAVDKVVGALVLDDRTALPAVDRGLYVSGRASIEMVQKAWAAGFGTLVAVSAPTALAVDAARRAGMQLAGFVRGDEFNLYSPAP